MAFTSPLPLYPAFSAFDAMQADEDEENEEKEEAAFSASQEAEDAAFLSASGAIRVDEEEEEEKPGRTVKVYMFGASLQDQQAELRQLRIESRNYIAALSLVDPIVFTVLHLYTLDTFKDVNDWLRLNAAHALPGSAASRQARKLWNTKLPVDRDGGWTADAVWGTSAAPRPISEWFQEAYNDPNWLPTVGYVVRGLRRVMRNAPRTRIPLELYRGVGNFPALKAGQSLITDQGLFSTSSNANEAMGRVGGGCCLLIVQLPAGVPVLNLQSVSHFPEESEWLLGPRVVMNVTQQSVLGDLVHFGPTTYPRRRLSTASSSSSTRAVMVNFRPEEYKHEYRGVVYTAKILQT